MPPVSVAKHFTYLVIGGGSGGIASARRAAEFKNVSVGLIEKARLGGTCVNVGCVPKKLMFHAASHAEELADMRDYGFKGVDAAAALASFDFADVKQRRDAYIKRLNGIYGNNLDNSKVEVIRGTAKFVGELATICGNLVHSRKPSFPASQELGSVVGGGDGTVMCPLKVESRDILSDLNDTYVVVSPFSGLTNQL